MIGIIDYGSGNINAIANIYKRGNFEYIISNDPDELRKASKLFIPGVGDFDETMFLLRQNGLKEALDEMVLREKKPVLGICVGMQVLTNSSDEGQESGLGWIPGSVHKFDTALFTQKPYLPHMGWNTVDPTSSAKLFADINHETGFYFLHSYYVQPESDAHIAASTYYGKQYASAVQFDNIFGFQFHPEKSHQNGITVLHNFAKL
jgi:imidazole glycerol-phosphate synthase subunit HisH